jgi:mono/diheme cytochrome c family protein
MYRLIAAAVLLFAIVTGASTRGYTQAPARAGNEAAGSYTKAQAERGKVVYGQYCSTCHLQSLKGNCTENLSSPTYVCAAAGSAPPLVGASFMKRFYSVGDLYSRVRGTMPAPGENTLSTQDNLAVVAYLLQANGVPVGAQELRAGNALKTMTLESKPTRMGTANITEPVNSVGISHAYYTEAQAERGKGYFYGSCAFCHTADPGTWKSTTMDRSTGLGWHRGPVNSYSLFATDAWLSSTSGIPGRPQRWSTVAELYNKIRTTQPAYDVAGLSNQAYLDMIAYLLKQNGFSAGKEELKGDLNQMRNMTLEKGFERLFNGKDLTGWRFVVGANCRRRPDGCGGDKPGGTFKIENGTILNTGSPHGYMYTAKKYWNFTFRLEYRMNPYEGMESDDDLFTNTGYFLFVNEHGVWPETLEIQGKNDFEMSLALGAAESTFKFDDAARVRARKPAGQWNAIQIVSKDGQVWTYLNGTQITHVTKHPFTNPGYIALQVESGPVHWRNIRIRED